MVTTANWTAVMSVKVILARMEEPVKIPLVITTVFALGSMLGKIVKDMMLNSQEALTALLEDQSLHLVSDWSSKLSKQSVLQMVVKRKLEIENVTRNVIHMHASLMAMTALLELIHG